MNVIFFQAKREKSVSSQECTSGHTYRSSIRSFPHKVATTTHISAEQRQRALAILLREAEELDQA